MIRPGAPERLRRRGRGQAMTEFALIAPIFFILVFGIIELGLLFGGQNGLVASARELARYAAPFRVKTAVDANAVCADTRLSSQLSGVLRRSIPGYVSTNTVARQVIYSWLQNPNGTYSVQLQIHVSYKFPLYVPFVGNLLDGLDGVSDNKFLLDATERMRIENEDLTALFLTAAGTDVTKTVTCNI
jgi:Flp pilus assembly protein TadG